MTNQDKIQFSLSRHGVMCDDCLSSMTQVTPRQQVNMLCRRLEQQRVVKRGIGFCARCGATKTVNRMTEIESLADPGNAAEKNPAPKPEVRQQFREGKFASGVIPAVVGDLVDKIRSGEIEVYNEFSLQHELGILIRNKQPEKLVQFERNVSYFGLGKSDFQKREIDIVVFNRKRTQLDAAIEL